MANHCKTPRAKIINALKNPLCIGFWVKFTKTFGIYINRERALNWHTEPGFHANTVYPLWVPPAAR